ncbi:MAG: ribosomal protein S18-alanine N-acetyltransferase [Clostridia bacterium]|nr:ribosomal protein S18-alanine N-acetyltransferase [Clostridia bacterium]
MSVIYRRMTLEDVPQVHQIELDTFHTPWSYQSFVDEMTTNKCARYIVAEEDGKVLGYAGAWLIFDEGHITNIAVIQSARGRGIGKGVTHELMQYAANMGVQYMTLEVRKSNTVAQNMYKSLGFIELGVRKRYYEDNGEDAYLYVCQNMPEVQEEFFEVTEDESEA